MDDKVGTKLQRTLKIGAGKGVIDGEEEIAPAGKRTEGGEIDQLEQRVARRLNPDQPGCGVDSLFDAGDVAGINIADINAPRTQDALKDPIGASVGVVAGEDLVAGLKHLQRGDGGGVAGAEGEAVLAVLQEGERGFESLTRGVPGTRILEAFAELADGVLLERRCLVDRHADGASARIGRLAVVDCESFKVHSRRDG